MAGARGEYRGNGKTVGQSAGSHELNGWVVVAILVLLLLFFGGIVVLAFRQGNMHRIHGSAGGPGRSDTVSSSDSGGSGGVDSGFSGGGGDSGGGGASGDW
jgi:uncharacterized protein